MSAHSAQRHLMACHECDCLHEVELPLQAHTLRCARCNAVLMRWRPGNGQAFVAWLCVALILYWIANAFPFMTLETSGRERHIFLATSIAALYQRAMPALAVLAFVLVLLAPLARIVSLLYLTLARRGPWWLWVYRLATGLVPWNMAEIYLLGALVAVVKLADLGALMPGPGFWAFLGLVLVMAWVEHTWDKHAPWHT